MKFNFGVRMGSGVFFMIWSYPKAQPKHPLGIRDEMMSWSVGRVGRYLIDTRLFVAGLPAPMQSAKRSGRSLHNNIYHAQKNTYVRISFLFCES